MYELSETYPDCVVVERLVAGAAEKVRSTIILERVVNRTDHVPPDTERTRVAAINAVITVSVVLLTCARSTDAS